MVYTIAIVGGTGSVGTTLASRLIAKGHHVLLGSRHPTTEKTIAAVAKIATAAGTHNGVLGSVKAIKDSDVHLGDVILLTPPSDSVLTLAAVKQLAASLGKVDGKVRARNCFHPYSAVHA